MPFSLFQPQSSSLSLMLLIQLTGGLALFLFGMKIGADGLKRGGGDGLRQMLIRMTSGPFRGVALGVGTTFMTQSSSATSVILVSLVNSSLLTMRQTLPVLLGAGIGTTLTVQLIAFRLFDYALLLVAVGIFLRLATSRSGARMAADITLGFGFIFYGMLVMSEALAPLKENPALASILLAFRESPWLALAVSTALTAVVQSSGATIAILLSFSIQGNTAFLQTAVPLILGANLGTCITAFLGAIGSSRDAHRVALAQFVMKMLGVTAAMFLIAPLARLTVLVTGGDPVRQIANLHTLFNLGMTAVLLPFTGRIAGLIRRIIPVREAEQPFSARYLDRKLLASPSIALEHARLEILRQADLIRGQLLRMETLFSGNDPAFLKKTVAEDEKADYLQQQISAYLNTILMEGLSGHEVREAERLFLINSDLESMGDVVVKNIVPLAKKLHRKKAAFSDQGQRELAALFRGLSTLFEQLLRSFRQEQIHGLENTLRAARRLATKSEALRRSHLKRLVDGSPKSLDTSDIHLDVIDNIRRMVSYIKGMCRYFVNEGHGPDTL